MTDKTTSTDRSRRSRAAAKLGMVWVQGYVVKDDAEKINAAIADAVMLIEDEICSKKASGE